MTDTPHKAKAYLMSDCPFSFKFLLFMTEAGLLDAIDVRRCDRADEDYQEIRTLLKEKAGKASFPTVEVSPGVYMNDSDGLIEHYASAHGITNTRPAVLQFYLDGVFSSVNTMFGENRDMKAKLAALNS